MSVCNTEGAASTWSELIFAVRLGDGDNFGHETEAPENTDRQPSRMEFPRQSSGC
jgi:hypothetical protein